MAASPIAFLIIVLATLTFEGLLFGEEIAEKSFPDLSSPNDDPNRDCSGFFDGFVCGIQNAIAFVANTFRVIGGAIAFFFNLITFNIPGAPWFVRVIAGGILGTGLFWPLATLFRGN